MQSLTGAALDGDPPHPVLAVKVDNTASSEPQVGLASADLVVEQLVEGGSTRLVAMFSSTLPGVVGPVRSARASDIGIVAPVNATVVASGGAPPTIRRLRAAKIATRVEGDPGYRRAGDRTAPYNVMVSLPELADSLPPAGDEVPEPYLPFGTDAADGTPARSFELAYTPGTAKAWRFSDGAYVRPGSFADTGDDFAADQVLVLRVRLTNAGYRDPAGNPVPETIVDGKGDAQLFHDGTVVQATWRKDGLDAPLQLFDAAGDELDVPPGRTWIGLVPVRGGAVRVGR